MRYAVALVATCALAACGAAPTAAGPGPSTAVETPTSSAATPSTSPSTSPTPSPTRSTARPTPSVTPRPPKATPTGPASLVGDRRNAWAFVPLAHPDRIVVEGSVPLEKAYSTSKVLVVCAFVDVVAHGDPGTLTARQRDLITRALTRSDMSALLSLQNAVPGSPQASIRRFLGAIGDTRTVVPTHNYGGMLWSPREQVRFMAALANGRVVNAKVSDYVLSVMHPIPAHSWGLGTIGASAFKGGWYRPYTDTRQMGIVDGYAVVIITYAVGPAVLQSDGDSAHVQQMNHLAALLKTRLAAESH